MTFDRWLRRRGYRESTAKKSVKEVELAQRLLGEGKELPPRLRPALSRYLTFATENDVAGERSFLGALRRQGIGTVEPRTGPPRRRRRPHEAFSLGDWQRLTGALEEDRSPCGTCLWVMCVTGLRVGDVLRIERRELQKGIKRGVLQLERKGGMFIEVPVEGAPEAWQRLLDGMVEWRVGGKVADWIVRGSSDQAGDAAYQAVNRYLRKLGEGLALQAPVHLQRIRRTVAIQALRLAGGDVRRVQQLLAHASPASTDRYIDELRSGDVAELQRKLAELRGPKT